MTQIEDPVALRKAWVQTVGAPAPVPRRQVRRTKAKLMTAVRWPRERAEQMDRFRRAARSRNMDYSDLVDAMFVLLEHAWETAERNNEFGDEMRDLLADLGLEPVTN